MNHIIVGYSIDLNTLVLLMVASMNAVTLYFTRKTEKNTNSMKDALVLSTAKASKAEGRQEVHDEQATADPIKVEVTKIPPLA